MKTMLVTLKMLVTAVTKRILKQGSWAEGLKNRLNNLRRTPRSGVTGMKFHPPSKKKKTIASSHHIWAIADRGPVDDHTYTRHKQAMKAEIQRKERVNR